MQRERGKNSSIITGDWRNTVKNEVDIDIQRLDVHQPRIEI
jgi:hypothetical protein